MKFGAQLENDLVKEWAEGYVNYKQLKKVLAELVKSGKSQEFSENSVYAAISVRAAWPRRGHLSMPWRLSVSSRQALAAGCDERRCTETAWSVGA
jgi:hypothetical protein